MGKPAARIIMDTAGHAGPIITGSTNVFIGRMPAARQGDSFICSFHGIGSITEGENTVLINGIPAARMGDKTTCAGSPVPPTLSPIKGGGTLKAFDGGKLGTVGYGITDSNQNGSYDTIEGSATAANFHSDKQSESLGFNVDKKSDTNLLNVSGKAQSTYADGVYNGNISGKGSVLSGYSKDDYSNSWMNLNNTKEYDALYGTGGAYVRYDGINSEIGGNYKVGGYSDTQTTNVNVGEGIISGNHTVTNDVLYSKGNVFAGGRGVGIENKTGVYSGTSRTEGQILGIGIKEKTDVDLVYVDGTAAAYTGLDGTMGYNVTGKAAVGSGNTEIGIGNEDSFGGYGAAIAKGDVLYAQAGARQELYIPSGDQHKIGFYSEGGASAGVASGSVGGKFSNMFVEGSAYVGGDVGAVGAYAEGGIYYDTKDHFLNISVSGELAIALGLKGDASLKLKFQPFIDFFDWLTGNDKTTVSPKPAVVPGIIISGCPTVLIGQDVLPEDEKPKEYTGSGWGHDFRQWIAEKLGIDNDITNLVDAGVLSMLQFDEANLTGEALEKVKADPAMVARENELVEMARNDPRYGNEAFSRKSSQGVCFGGERAPGEMWDQFKDPLNPEYRATWEVAGNELTWLIRNTNVTSTVDVAADGSMTINHNFSDVFDLRPSQGRSDAYNTATEILGTGYHDILGGNDELKINAEWTSKR